MYANIATITPRIIATGMYHISVKKSRKLENHIVNGGNCSFDPKLSNTPCIIGTDITVPTTANNIKRQNCTKFGINISLNFLFIACVSSKY